MVKTTVDAMEQFYTSSYWNTKEEGKVLDIRKIMAISELIFPGVPPRPFVSYVMKSEVEEWSDGGWIFTWTHDPYSYMTITTEQEGLVIYAVSQLSDEAFDFYHSLPSFEVNVGLANNHTVKGAKSKRASKSTLDKAVHDAREWVEQKGSLLNTKESGEFLFEDFSLLTAED